MSDLKITYNTKLYSKWVNNTKGWGVFTNTSIKQNEIVETCICILAHPDHQNYSDFLFTAEGSGGAFLPFGFGSVYNHSFEANLVWRVISVEKRLLQFVAARDINADEELTHNYGTEYWNHRKHKQLL